MNLFVFQGGLGGFIHFHHLSCVLDGDTLHRRAGLGKRLADGSFVADHNQSYIPLLFQECGGSGGGNCQTRIAAHGIYGQCNHACLRIPAIERAFSYFGTVFSVPISGFQKCFFQKIIPLSDGMKTFGRPSETAECRCWLRTGISVCFLPPNGCVRRCFRRPTDSLSISLRR